MHFLLSPGGITLRLSALKKGKKLPGGASYPIQIDFTEF